MRSAALGDSCLAESGEVMPACLTVHLGHGYMLLAAQVTSYLVVVTDRVGRISRARPCVRVILVVIRVTHIVRHHRVILRRRPAILARGHGRVLERFAASVQQVMNQTHIVLFLRHVVHGSHQNHLVTELDALTERFDASGQTPRRPGCLPAAGKAALIGQRGGGEAAGAAAARVRMR